MAREIAIAAMTAKLRLPDDAPADKPKRKPIPDHIPRVEVELTPGSAKCAHCGGKLRRLGEDVTEELEYVPGRFIVNRPACICTQNHDLSGCAGRGDPGWPVPAAIASRSHLCRHARSNAGVPVRAFLRMCWSTSRRGPWPQWGRVSPADADHLPLYRQSQIFDREGLDLDRSTLADWVGKSTALLEPLADAIGRHVLAGQAIFADGEPLTAIGPREMASAGRDARPPAPARPRPPGFGPTAEMNGEPLKAPLVQAQWRRRAACAERAMRSVALGRKNYLFVGSQTGGNSAAIAYTMIETAKLNCVDPQAWLADTLARIPDHKINRINDLLPWNARWPRSGRTVT